MKRRIINWVLGFIVIGFVTSNALAKTSNVAPVSGFARSFLLGSHIANATITVLETGMQIKTDAQGRFGPIYYPIGKPITLVLERQGYHTTQSATILVPREGLTGPYNHISFQVPSEMSYWFLSKVIGAKEDPNSCHVATTITAYHKNMDDDPQGEEGATVVITPNMLREAPFYFDIFKTGTLKDKTNPFTKGLSHTSEDGGVLLFNLPPRDKPYRMSASKPGVRFSSVEFLCRKGMFINLSPPQGPMATGRWESPKTVLL